MLDLGLDSLERLEIARILERTFGGRFPEQVLDEIETIGQTALAIERYLPSGSGARADAFLGGESPQPSLSAETPIAAAEAVEPESRVEDFAEYKRLQNTKQQMMMTGVPNPYFTVHEGVVRDTTVVDGQELISFASYNYLGLSGHPSVVKAAAAAVEQYGTVSQRADWCRVRNPFTANLKRRLRIGLGLMIRS